MRSKGGRYGKYGEHKKNERLRQAHISGPEHGRDIIKRDENRKIAPGHKNKGRR